jgi:hypothetical protein
MRSLIVALTAALSQCGCLSAGVETTPADLNRNLVHLNLKERAVSIGKVAKTGVRIDSLAIREADNLIIPSPSSFLWMNTDPGVSGMMPIDDVVFVATLMQTGTSGTRTFDPADCYAALISQTNKLQVLRDLLSSAMVVFRAPNSDDALPDTIRRWGAVTDEDVAIMPTIVTIWPGSDKCKGSAIVQSFDATDIYWSGSVRATRVNQHSRFPLRGNPPFSKLSTRITPLVSVQIEGEASPRLVPFWMSVAEVAKQAGRKAPQYVVRSFDAFRNKPGPLPADRPVQIVFSDSPFYSSERMALKLKKADSTNLLVAPGDVIFVDD